MKVIDLKDLLWDERNLAEKEANLLTTLQHQYILHAVTAFQENETLCIVTEFCDQGDLEQFLKARAGQSLVEERIVEWFRQICSALEVIFLTGKIKFYLSSSFSLTYLVLTFTPSLMKPLTNKHCLD